MNRRVLIFEHCETLPHILVSGSYWFRLEMAHAFWRLGWQPSLIQYPNYSNFPWVSPYKLDLQEPVSEIRARLNEFDLILLLGDHPVPESIQPRDPLIVYWDIEGLPPDPLFFDQTKIKLSQNEGTYYGAKFESLTNELERFHFHFIHQRLRYWQPHQYFSVAQQPLIHSSAYLPLGAEPDLYNLADYIRRDIPIAIVASTSRWFQAEERIAFAAPLLRSLGYPKIYWYGSYPEQDMGRLPQNCYSMGHVDYLSLRFLLKRIQYLIHIPRPYHCQSRTVSATLYQALAAKAIPIQCFPSEFPEIPGYSITSIHALEDLQPLSFPEEWTYQSRFRSLLISLSEEGLI